MLRCQRCRKLMSLKSSSVYCRNCAILNAREDRIRKGKEERLRKEEEERIHKVQEECLRELEIAGTFQSTDSFFYNEDEEKELLNRSKDVVKQYIADEIDQNEVIQLLRKKAISAQGIWQGTDRKDSFLSGAIEKGNYELFSYLIENGSDVNEETYTITDQAGFKLKIADTPITLAIRYSQFDMADELLTHGADINKRIQLGPTKIHIILLIAGMGNTQQLRWLLDHGVSPNQESSFINVKKAAPLYYAISSKKHDNARLLIAAGANPNFIIRGEQADYSALNYTIMNNDLVGFKILMEAHADPNCVRVSHIGGGDNPALCDAVSESRYEMVRCLLQAGANKNCYINYNGRRLSIKELAMLNQDYKMLTLLRTFGIY